MRAPVFLISLKTLPNAASGGLQKNKKQIKYFAGMKKPINLLPLLKHYKITNHEQS